MKQKKDCFHLEQSTERFIEKEQKSDKRKALAFQNTGGCRLQYQFATNLDKVCEKQKIKGEKIPKILDISCSDLSEYRNGKKGITLQKLEELSKKLNVSPYFLLGVTDNPKSMDPLESNCILGLSLDARYSLVQLYCSSKDYNEEIPVEFVDEETGELDINVLPTGIYKKNFEIFSSFISNLSKFRIFFDYIKKYVNIKQKINKCKNNSDTAQIKSLEDNLSNIKKVLAESVFENLDMVASNHKKERR